MRFAGWRKRHERPGAMGVAYVDLGDLVRLVILLEGRAGWDKGLTVHLCAQGFQRCKPLV